MNLSPLSLNVYRQAIMGIQIKEKQLYKNGLNI